ncbi:hypothetical protein HDK90DRAFT_462836 [Phyllosticta capitalensis]|uniref:Uncharacterized protein n=1 Tax=Phyllosticta capitalensis TaxID=121624 RepID=A0ABR1YZ52_9PEZI
MPNFVPKAFQRRKSAGNAMEDLLEKPTGTSSFRVMPRNEVQDSASPSFTVRRTVAARPVSSFEPRPIVSPVQHTRQPSYDDGIRNIGNRGSNGSSAGNSSRFYDTGSSQRYSSSSTLPSSTDIEEENLFTKKVPTPGDGGRTSSFTSFTRLPFGKKKSHKDLKSEPPKLFELEPMPDPMSGRDRALTASSSASTAHPPKLEDLPKADFGNDLSDLFGSFANDRRSAPLEDSAFALPPPPLSVRSGSDSALPPPPKALVPAVPPAPASPVRVVKRPDMIGSPYSWHSQDSNEALMSSSPPAPTPPRVETLPPAPATEPPPPPQPRATSTSPVYERKFGSNGLTKRPKAFEDEDARMVRDSFRKSRESRELERASAAQTAKRNQDDEPHSSDVSTKSASFSSGESSIHQHQPPSPPSPEFMDDSTPRARAQNEEEQPLFNRTSWNKSTSPNGRPGVRFEETKPKPRMTQAEFARLKRQHLREPQSDESESEADEYIDDDQEEEERKKMEEMRKIRQEQQEKMNAHREMMKKTTGGMNRPLSGERPGLNRSSLSSSELLGYHASAAFENAEDDSDDIPLGILKEHNFPKLGNRLSHASSHSNLRSASAQGFRPGSAMDGDHRGSLPPFARNLPADVPQEPYYGANLVQQSARESLGFGAIGPGPMGPGSAYGGSNSGVGASQPTLVNMIADAEQAKEARRGGSSKIYGSNTFGNSTFGQRIPQTTQQPQPQMQMPQQNMGMMPMQPMSFMPQQQMQQQMLMPPMNMGIQQMQIQMQQMQQMANLQQQMQNMLQQQQASMIPQPMMQSPMMQPGMMPQMPPQMPQSNFLTPNQGQRAMSMGNGPRPTSVFNPAGRTSTMNMSSMGQRFGSHLATGYAPSLAPSERSNIGKSARYRPVSQQIHDGSSTVMSQTTVQPAPAQQASFQQPSPERLTIRVKPKPARTPTEDDDEGWTSPKAKKWAAKSKDKENQQLPELTFSADE